MSGLSCVQRFFSTKRSKLTNLENQLHISIESQKEGFNDVFQHFAVLWMN